jgi:hypothetical protein
MLQANRLSVPSRQQSFSFVTLPVLRFVIVSLPISQELFNEDASAERGTLPLVLILVVLLKFV